MTKEAMASREASKIGFERIAVVGSSCSGKTTLARDLSSALGAPHVELDALYWQADWKPRTPLDFRRRVEGVVLGDRWIVDGNYAIVRDLVWSRATAAVWLNYPFWLVFPRAVSRTLRRAVTREELYSENTESLSKAFFSRHSILLWVITSFRRQQREYAELRASRRFPQVKVLELRRPSQALRLLTSLKDAV
jgi:adenylate kinase family enzyme